MKKRIFISYRRSEAQYVVGRIYDKLCASYGEDKVFKDIDSIPLGVDFREIISSSVQACDVLLVVISESWSELKDENGNIRLNDPNDYVRIEVETALERSIPVIPITINNASLPKANELPDSLKPLTYRNSIAIRPDPDFNNDFLKLKKDLNKVIKKKNKLYLIIAISIVILSVVSYLLFLNINSGNHTKVTTAIATSPRIVHIQYFNDSSKSIILSLRSELQKIGFKTFGEDKINKFEFRNMVKYFNPKDLNDADKLAKYAKRFFDDNGCPIDVIELIPASSKQKDQALELWINKDCN